MRACATLLLSALSSFAFAAEPAPSAATGDRQAGDAVADARVATDAGATDEDMVAPVAVDPASIDPASIAPARLARAERMLEATRFGTIYDVILSLAAQRPLPEGASMVEIEDRRLRERLIGLMRWRDVESLWRLAFAAALSDEALDAISAFHEGGIGRAVAECTSAATDMLAVTECQIPGDEALGAAVHAFKAMPASVAYEQAAGRMMVPLMTHALRLALLRDPDAATALAAKCGRDPVDGMCEALSPAVPASR